tara:strand:+ start:314 stop:466 length:153 start_codon:yes stop_codon:yes gene_type:complete
VIDMDMDGNGKKCSDCGEKFNQFSSYDFEGKLCNKCFGKTTQSQSMFGGL